MGFLVLWCMVEVFMEEKNELVFCVFVLFGVGIFLEGECLCCFELVVMLVRLW